MPDERVGDAAKQAIHFRLASTDEEVEVSAADTMMSTGMLRLHWETAGDGRAALEKMLSELFILEVDRLASAAAQGRVYRVAPLQELSQRGGWTLETRPVDSPTTYRLARDGEDESVVGPRQELLLTVELLLRCALLSRPSEEEEPSWVDRARRAHGEVLHALNGHAVFEPAEDAGSGG
jgi:hypothetical protein